MQHWLKFEYRNDGKLWLVDWNDDIHTDFWPCIELDDAPAEIVDAIERQEMVQYVNIAVPIMKDFNVVGVHWFVE